MNEKLQDALETCLQRMAQGETLDSLLGRYPGLAVQLSPLLKAAAHARSVRRESLPSSALARQRSRGLALAAELRPRKNRPLLLRGFWRISLTALSVIAILVLSSNGLLDASAHSIPGDTLYPLKRSVESTQLHLTSDPAEKEVLEQTFSERRVDETRSLITIRRSESVEFTGIVSSQTDVEWIVSGIPVVITSDTDMDDGIIVGDEIDVRGSTNPAGDVEAIFLSLVNVPDPDDLPAQFAPKDASSQDESAGSNISASATETPVPDSYSNGDGSQGGGSNEPTQSGDHHSGEDSHTGDNSYDRGEDH
ncbi:MAG: DUF5667 domain-containing protein [Anaerolineales bacterium]|jgi:hypothetical protein